MIVWHVLAILAVQALSSGRAAILGYTMPIFSALWGVALFGERLRPRHVAGVVAAGLGVSFLLWHEFATIAGRPLAALGMLAAAALWALGTQQMRRTRIAAPTLAIVFWMTLASTLVMSIATLLFERHRWAAPNASTLAAIAYNAVLIFGVAQAIWLSMARNLPPIASSMSVMLIPVLGTVSGAWWLGESLHWQDGAANRPRAARHRLGDVAGARSARTRARCRGRQSLTTRRAATRRGATVRPDRDRRSPERAGSRARALPSARRRRRARGRSLARAASRGRRGARSARTSGTPCAPASRSTTGAHSTRSALSSGSVV
jgi:hypothetical protein